MSSYNGWRSARLIYRAIEEDDKAFIAELASDWTSYVNAAPFLPVPQGTELAKSSYEFMQKSLLGAILCLPATETTEAGSMTKSKPTPIGILNLSNVSDPRLARHRGTMIGIQIVKPYQGQGYGTEAIRQVLLYACNFAFKHANLHRVGIGAYTYNAGAVRLYERLGFIVEAKRRDFVWHDGKYWDCVELAMLEDEWREKYADKE